MGALVIHRIGASGRFYRGVLAVLMGTGLVPVGVSTAFGNPRAGRPKETDQATRIRFERIPASSLPRFVHFNGSKRASLLPEDNGSGCAWGDYDGDGDDDLYLCNMNGPLLMDADKRRRSPGSRLWRNDGGGRFTDVTESCGLGESRMDMAALFADFDNDGDADLLVTGLRGVRLFRNDGGRYHNVTEQIGLGGVTGYCLGAAWGDYDRDGRLDLYICRYVDFPLDKARKRPMVAGRPAPMTTPANYPPLTNHLFRQEQGGTFRDVTKTTGTAAPQGRSMQAIWCDFDNNGWIDLYVANDQSLDCLFMNKGDGTFEDAALPSGVFDPRGGMGMAVIDFQADGDQDLLVTHWVSEDPGFYVNELIDGQCFFEDRAVRYGLRKPDTALVGWGVEFEDFDNDGDRDLLMVYGSTIEDELTLDVLKDPKMLPQRARIYEWRKKRWHALGDSAGAYFGEVYVGRGAALADFDRDGRRDIAINNHGAAPALLRNVSQGPGRWLDVKLVGRHCARDAANARVTVYRKDAPPQMRELFIGSSYLSGHGKTLHFGLGKAGPTVDVQVRWPCGRTQRLDNVSIDQTIVITETRDKAP
jgi:hypothetical protein